MVYIYTVNYGDSNHNSSEDDRYPSQMKARYCDTYTKTDFSGAPMTNIRQQLFVKVSLTDRIQHLI